MKTEWFIARWSNTRSKSSSKNLCRRCTNFLFDQSIYVIGSFLCILEIFENLWFYDSFRGYQMRIVACNGLNWTVIFPQGQFIKQFWLCSPWYCPESLQQPLANTFAWRSSRVGMGKLESSTEIITKRKLVKVVSEITTLINTNLMK